MISYREVQHRWALSAHIVVQETAEHGACETVRVLIATYNEEPELVRECVVRLLVAPEPLYMEKIIYVCDDGYANPEGAAKKKMVEELNALGAPHIPFPHLRCCCFEF